MNDEVSVRQLHLQPTLTYSPDPLMALHDGAFFRNLTNQTVKLVIAATRGMRRPQSETFMIPVALPAQDVIHLYFFSQPSSFSTREALLDPGLNAEQRVDTNWLALPRPDLLILTNQRQLLTEVLDRISRGSKTRALPAALPEWAQVDVAAPRNPLSERDSR